MSSKTHGFVVDSIMSDIRLDKYSMYSIAKMNGVSSTVVQRLFATFMYESKPLLVYVMDNGKQEAYQTEEQALEGIPTYTATNHKLIKPIQKGWQLITYEK